MAQKLKVVITYLFRVYRCDVTVIEHCKRYHNKNFGLNSCSSVNTSDAMHAGLVASWKQKSRSIQLHISADLKHTCCCFFAFSAFTLLVGHWEVHLTCKKWVMGCWCGYLPGLRCRLFAYGPADATAFQNPIVSSHLIQTGFYCTTLVRYMLWSCVCLSVTSWCSTKTAKLRSKQTTPLDSPETLAFWCQKSPRNSTSVNPCGGAKCRWGWLKSATFDK